MQLVSGSKDTDIIVWDLIGEVGMFKLRGHKDQITGIHFLNPAYASSQLNGDQDMPQRTDEGSHQQGMYIVSVGKDALLKLWDLAGRHCIETHVAQSNGQCWALGVSADQSGVITAGNEGELRIWSVNISGLCGLAKQVASNNKTQYLRERGSLYRQVKDRTTGVAFHPGGSYIAAHGTDRLVQIWRVRSEGEIQKKLTRKRKRRREKSGELEEDPRLESSIIPTEDISSAGIDDLLAPHVDIRTSGRVRSICWAHPGSRKAVQLLIAQSNNQLELFSAPVRAKDKAASMDDVIEASCTSAIELPGHRTDIRALAVSSDDRMLASASQGTLKVWNLRTYSCIRTLDCGYALCSAFLPGDKVVVVGNRHGELELFNISSSTLIETIKAHDEKIWSIHVHPDGKSLVTASEDKSVKFFKFEVIQEEIPGTERTAPKFKLVHTRTLKVNDAILSIRYSPDARLIALALLDNTVKVFFSDSLKLWLNLYGHKLPVLSLDISYDSKLIVTCSADKNVRLWGLDFGDCHKAFFAHQDSITQVGFVPKNVDGNGHHFFSASKDRAIKYWDGDKFEQIQKLGGHHGEIWAMVISHSGEFLVTAGHDKSIRVWSQTDEPIFLEEEREKEMEDLYESTLATNLEQEEGAYYEKPEATGAGKQTTETLMAGEKIAEALELGLEDLQIMKEYEQARAVQPKIAPPDRHPIFLAHNNVPAERHLLNTVQKIQAAALKDALLVLTFNQVCAFFTFVRIWAEKHWNIALTANVSTFPSSHMPRNLANNASDTPVTKVFLFLLKTHWKQIVASKGKQTRNTGVCGQFKDLGLSRNVANTLA